MEETNPLLSEEDRSALSSAAPIDSAEWTGGDPNAVSMDGELKSNQSVM